MDLTWTVERAGGVSLVRCRVHNDGAVPRRVRVESRLDGPVLPPRRAGIPEAGWDESGITLRLDPDERRALGFAAPAPPVEPPVSVTRSAAVDGERSRSEANAPAAEARGSGSETARSALQDLAEHRPPRAAIATGGDTGDARTDGDTAGGDARRLDREAAGDGAQRLDQEAAGSATGDGGSIHADRGPPSKGAIDEWVDAVERRIERAERVTDADLSTATAVVEAAGGIDEVRALGERVESDAERLRELSERTSALAARAEATDAPVGALERLA